MPSNLEAALAFASHADWPRVVSAARQALTNEPDDALAHALLALALAHLEQGKDAVDAGRRAVALAPELSFAHYALGWALLERAELNAAERSAQEALRLEPDSHGYALLAQIYVRRKRWAEAIKAAEQGLQIEPEHPGCANLRALSLGALGRTDVAAALVNDVLALDPDDAFGLTNRGWLMLRQSRPQEALESFREALRLDPTLDWARTGIVEALKARSALYRFVLRYELWVASLTSRAQWFLILGLFFGGRVVRALLRSNPGLWPVLGPLMALYIFVVFGSWIANPLSNLLLRLNPFGRLALNRAETVASNVVGGCLVAAVIGVAAYAMTSNAGWIVLAIVSAFLLIPVGGTARAHGSRAFRPLLVAAALLGACGIASALLVFSRMGIGDLLFGVFLLGTVVYGWGANILFTRYA
ncbi:MAG TPA: tetratricopeptide repeat protein [Vicinamibacterales bacterium]|jgi:tetratricopeptide (TPR) repeat protein|nr:tetratricopeptide repeat protein [Vicinamibacterales bacterium]